MTCSAAGKPNEALGYFGRAYPGRFLLGLAVGHPEAISDRVAAAAGPRTPEHTAPARALLGRSAFLAPEHKPEHKVVATTDPAIARAVGRKAPDR